MLIAKITGKNINYDMHKNIISIGRNSASGNVDIDMGNSTFVSRKHLEILYLDNVLKLRCLGKNGIFVNDLFKQHSSKSSILYDLPNKCHLRFPSTNVRLSVSMLAEPKKVCVNVDDTIDSEYKSTDKSPNYPFHSNKPIDYQSLSSYDQSAFQDASALLSLKGKGVPFPPVCSTDNGEVLNENQSSDDLKEDYLIKEEEEDDSMTARLDSTANNQAYPVDYSNDDMSIDRGSELTKPPYSYAQLIVQSIMSTNSHQMTLSGIYAYISQNYPYYKLKDKGWQNSIRHNLSLNRYFVKVARSQEEPGKGSFWRVDPHYKKPLIQQAFRRRRHRRLPMTSSVPIPEHAVLSNGKLFVPRGSTTLLPNDRPQFFKIK